MTLVHPLALNRAALGLDYRKLPSQWEAVSRVRDRGVPVLAGPVDLVQGSNGLIGRLPVFTTGPDGQRRFWGIVSTVIDINRLYRTINLLDPALPLDLVIHGADTLGPKGSLIFGNPSDLDDGPVEISVVLPSGSWILSATPRGGWSTTPDNLIGLRTMIAIAGLLIVLPMLFAGRLLDERRENVQVLRAREKQLELLSHRLTLALESSRIGLWEYDIESPEIFPDDRMRELYDFPVGYPVTGADMLERLFPEDADTEIRNIARAVSNNEPYNSTYRIRCRNGEIRHIRAIGRVFAEPGKPRLLIGVAWDVTADAERNAELRAANALLEARNTELEHAKAAVEETSLHDFLTGLPNRRHLDVVLERLRSETGDRLEKIAILQIDVDRFKQINDTHGHAAGDAVLVHAARMMRRLMYDGEFLARIGGDEFVVVCSLESDPLRAERLAGGIVETMRQPFEVNGVQIRIGVSIGVASADCNLVDRERLLTNADVALYRAKHDGRNRFSFYTDALHAEIVSSKRLADEILAGLETGAFEPFYQPQVDARTREIVGVEALVRWRHPTRGILTPDAFLRIAEEIDVLATIDRQVLEKGLADLSEWRAAGVCVPRLSVNVSARRLNDPLLVPGLLALGLAPGTVSFELLESIYLDESSDVVAWNLDRIRELGIGLEIDDFGTGYASIVSLTKLKPNRLKIDRQLTRPVVDSLAGRSLVQAIVEMGRSLEIEILAEGVETAEQAEILTDLGCDALQGYHFAAPLSRSAIAAHLAVEPVRMVG